jgi:soluble lytic murein transglycosylase-like protein
MMGEGKTMRARNRIFVVVGLAFCAVSLRAASGADLKKLYSPIIKQVAERNKVPEELIHAIIRAESNYDNFALSDKGAMGLMQLMPETAAQYGVKNVFDAAQNVEGGTKYLKDLMKLYGNKTDLVLAAYNAGQEAVKRYGGKIPPYQETRDYIARVKASYPTSVIHHGYPAISDKPIIKMYDESGHLVLTNDPEYFRLKKKG